MGRHDSNGGGILYSHKGTDLILLYEYFNTRLTQLCQQTKT